MFVYYSVGKKSICISYLLLVFGGWMGLHLLYLRRDIQAFVYWCTFGGYFGLAPLRDFYRIPAYVKEANNDPKYYEHLARQIHRSPTPPFSVVRFVGQILVGNSWCFLWIAALPEESILGPTLVPLKYLGALAAAIGVWLISNIGREKGELKWCIIGAYAIAPLVLLHFETIHWTCVSSSVLLHWKGKSWRRTPTHKQTLCKRFLYLSLGWMVFCSLWASYIYFNAEVTYKDGEKAKMRDAIHNFFKSPMFLEFKNNAWKLYEDAKEFGWSVAWRNLIELLDPLGEQHALKVLELERGASQEDISSRFKSLSKMWHPDRNQKYSHGEQIDYLVETGHVLTLGQRPSLQAHPDFERAKMIINLYEISTRHRSPESKKAAQEKFVEIAEAYEKLSDIKQRRKFRAKNFEMGNPL